MNPHKIFSIAVLFILTTCISPVPSSAQNVSVTFQVFYDQLGPYGQWMNDPDYGYVWSPNVSGFEPYSTNGYWIYTDYGWTWVSNYSWGWAPFHYGRWDRRSSLGWIWIPDNEWGPAWVYWRSSPGYYGWAPMGHGNNNDYYGDNNRWRFVRDRDFGRQDIHNYYQPRTNNVTIIKNSYVIKNNGPDVNEVQKQGGRNFNQVKVGSYNKPGQNLTKDKLDIYRPQVEKNSGGQKPMPSKVIDPSKSGGNKPSPSKMASPANNGGAKQSPPQQQQQRQAPSNSGGAKQSPPQQQQQQRQVPSNSGGAKQSPPQQQQQQRQAPSNNGGAKQSPPQQQQQRQAPSNSGGAKQSPPQQQQQQRQAPSNSGGVKQSPPQQQQQQRQAPSNNGGAKQQQKPQ